MKNLQKSIFLAIPAAFLFAAQGAGTPEISEKYYRLAIREIRGGDIVQLGEFSLYAADGSRVNGGGMELVDPCAPKSLAPGACFASQSNFPGVTADKLFDGNPKTKLCVGKLALRENDPSSWLNIYFRLPDSAKPVAKYNFCSANDTDRFPERNPTSWAIWCSADGDTWRPVDERTNAFSPKSMLTWWNGSRPYSFGGETPCADMADEVNPFIGAVTQHPRSRLGGHGLGKTFPGAATPCGMIQLSPDTITGGDNGCGYSYHHETIEGFSFTHLSGVGWYGDFGNFQVMPTVGARNLDRDKAKSAYSHEREVAEAGYYAVTLDRYNIRAEMTAAPRAGILCFTYPESKEARIQIDLGRRVGQLGRWLKHSRQHVRVVDDHTIEGRMECPWQDGGWGRGAGRVHYVLNFTCAFSKPFKRFGVWDKDKVFESCRDYTGTNTGFFAEFETSPGEQILVRAGLSYVDQEGARKNLASDIPDFDFDRARRAARALWSDAFAGVMVKGGSVDERIVFATCLYHALIDPRMIGDVDGRYMGSDGKIYHNERFTARTVFSGWDCFRSEMPLLTLIRPDIVNDLVSSMMRWMELGPRTFLPVFDIFGCTSGCMLGNPILPVMVDAYEKGIHDYDVESAWKMADHTSRVNGNPERGWTVSKHGISHTLEYAYNDWCMGKFAEMLGKKDDAKRYYARAGWYRNVWSEEVGWMRNRRADGSWMPWRGRHVHGQGAIESNPWQQGWFVPHDVYGLMELMGGEKKFADELELFFDKAPSNFLWGDSYNHPNEVTHLVPFMFPYCGKPWLTQKWTRRICEGAYGNEVYGYVGNEDEGQMSAWYILAASGLHPQCPGSGVWILTSPVFPEVSFRLDPKYAKGERFTVRANGVSKKNTYIRSAKLNGKPLDRAWITTKEVTDGGLLELEMDSAPAYDAFPVRPPQTMMRSAEAKSCRLTFSCYEGKETLRDFPALVKIPDGLTGFDYRDSTVDGSDITFFGADGQPLAYEIDTWNPEGDSYVWVRVPEVTKATTITARWGEQRARCPLSQCNGRDARTTGKMPVVPVWNDDYLAVWHFSKFKKGVTRDSKNGLEAEVRGKDTRLFIHADAFVGKGYYAAAKTTKWGTYLNVPNDPRWTAYEKTGKLTVSFMVNSTIDPDTKTEEHHARIVSNKADFGDDKGFEVAIAGGERVWSCGRGVTNFWYDVNRHGGMDKYSFRDDWAHVTVTYDAEEGESAIYFNGRRVASAKGAAYAPTATGLPLAIGHFATALVYERAANEEYFCGYLDEMRLSKAALSPDRIRADYLTLTRPTQFAVAEGGKVARVLTRRLAEGDTPPVAPDVGSWRGVNAVSMFYSPWNKTDDCAYGRYLESEFALFKKCGLNFARLPIDYRFFVSAYDWEHWLEDGLEKVDAAVEYGRKYGIHVNLCLYRAPGKIAYPAEKGTNAVTRDPVALEAFKRIWREFARRYKGIPNSELSFNLVNEPTFSEKDFIHVFGETVDAIHKVDPGRFIILDGNQCATKPVPHFFNVPLTGQSFRGYAPGAFSHYGVWYGGHPKVKPHWPKNADDKEAQWVVDGQAKMLAKQNCIPKGYPVMIGEFGCYAKMDHESCLKWMEAGFKEWRKRGYGWAIWDYDGPFGFVDSGRPDAEYIEIDGRKIDRKMLELLRQK